MTWSIEYHNEKLLEEILEMPEGLLARYLQCVDRMELFGPNLGMPHTKSMGSGLFELRLKSKEGIARVFYCTVINQTVVMLHQFVKKTDKTPTKELDMAIKRMKEWKNVDT